jgi:hypothetical protein
MEEYRIKVLKETPFDKANTILSTADFRYKYSYLINTHNSDKFLAKYLKEEYKQDNADLQLDKWFEVIEIAPKFKVGDWVWHEGLKRAFTIVITNTSYKDFRPNYVTLAAVDCNPQIYKRLATAEEIKLYDLMNCDGQVLIGRHKSYYFNTVWKELIGIHYTVSQYFIQQRAFDCSIQQLAHLSTEVENTFVCKPNGLKVGCKVITHDELITIARFLDIKI